MPSQSFLNAEVKTSKTQPRVPKGTPKAGGQFAEDRKPDGGDLDLSGTDPDIPKPARKKREDKWSPSNIDWKRLELVMVVEPEEDFDHETGKSYTYAYDYIIKDALPIQFENTTDSNARLELMEFYDLAGITTEKWSRCGVCGHALKYGGVLVDLELHDGTMVGFDCLATYNAVTDGLVNAQYKARNAAARARGDRNFERCCDENEGLREAFATASENSTVSDIKHKLRQYGSLSERQVALVKKIATSSIEHAAERAEADALAAAAPDAPVGKNTVVGTILSTKYQEPYVYGGAGQLKMLVQSDEGWKVWVSMPVSLTDVEIERDGKTTRVNAGKGDKIQFDASLERSQDDAKFAFGKRPTKASVVEWGE
jgi:hypothetical protein